MSDWDVEEAQRQQDEARRRRDAGNAFLDHLASCGECSSAWRRFRADYCTVGADLAAAVQVAMVKQPCTGVAARWCPNCGEASHE